MPVGCQQTVEEWSDQRKGSQRGESCQPFPAWNLGQNSPPGRETLVESSISISNPHRLLVGLEGQRELVFALGPKIDESKTSVRITKLAPGHRSLAQAAVAVNPDFEGSKIVDMSLQKRPPHPQTSGFLLTFLKKILK